MTARQTKYRADIDGLRALAVVPVVLYHAGIPGFSGGFTGVDIFFVISGYLITTIIFGEMTERRFSIVGFYERRVRRIFPALLSVLAFSWIAGFVLMLPADFALLGRGIVATVLFASNILSYVGTAGYFDAASETKPLLHMWSLAVEEQYYLLFPPLLWMLNRYLPRRTRQILWIFVILSFAANCWATINAPRAAFYLPVPRAWELLLGSLAAMKALRLPNHRLAAPVAGIAGLAMIVTGMTLLTADSVFPGYNALLPCVGAVLLILAGETRNGIATAILSTRPLVVIGLISYSLYLWHWPLLAFARYSAKFPLVPGQTLAIVALSFLLAILSTRYIEAPFRRRREWQGRRSLFVQAGAASAVVVLLGGAVWAGKGLPQRVPARVLTLANYPYAYMDLARCEASMPGDPRFCTFGHGPVVAVWGDSHAGAILPGILREAERHGYAVRLFIRFGCPPLDGINVAPEPASGNCRTHNRLTMETLTRSDITTIVMVARWPVFVKGPVVKSDGATLSAPLIVDDHDRVIDQARRQRLLDAALDRTVGALSVRGKHIFLTDPVPELDFEALHVMALHLWHDGTVGRWSVGRSAVETRQRETMIALDHTARRFGAGRIALLDRLCSASECFAARGNIPLYKDSDHLSMTGATFLSNAFAPLFAPRPSPLLNSALTEPRSDDIGDHPRHRDARSPDAGHPG